MKQIDAFLDIYKYIYMYKKIVVIIIIIVITSTCNEINFTRIADSSQYLPNSWWMADAQMSALKFFMVANLRYQLSYLY